MARDYVWQALWDQLVTKLGTDPFIYLYLGTTLVKWGKKPSKIFVCYLGVKRRLLGSWLPIPLLWRHTETRGRREIQNITNNRQVLMYFQLPPGSEAIQGPARHQRTTWRRETEVHYACIWSFYTLYSINYTLSEICNLKVTISSNISLSHANCILVNSIVAGDFYGRLC